MGFDQNHIHIFCGVKPIGFPTKTRNIIKSLTARKVSENFSRLKMDELWGGEFWNDGKYIWPVGESASEETIKKYIRNKSKDKF